MWFTGLLGSCLSKEFACLHNPTESMEIACPRGRVIVHPRVKVGKMTSQSNIPGTCTLDVAKDCFGTTPEVVVQTNDCNFRQVCIIRLNQFMPITDSNDGSCLSKKPDYAIVESFDCIYQETLQFVCKSTNEEYLITHMEGTLVSHRDYPWNYRTEGALDKCCLNFPSKPNFILTLWATDFDLDPDSKDMLTLYNITETGRKEAIHRFSTKVFQEQGLNITLESSTMEIVFSRTLYSKAGRGFVIKYKWIPIGGETHVATQTTTDICLTEVTENPKVTEKPKVTKKPKKKRKGKKNKNRKRNRKNKKRNNQKTKNRTKNENKNRRRRKNKGKQKKPEEPNLDDNTS